ncbi:hypothetical protein JVU11DRAFT_4555 [Chiua virens]|nr:hypothetical protein JVU11DRAFT_4555 [Chiua virens]
MKNLQESFLGASSFGTGQHCCYDSQYRPMYHGLEQRYISPTTGKCRPLVVQAVHPKHRQNIERIEVRVGDNTPKARKLALWLVLHAPYRLEDLPMWLVRWAWFTLALIWPFNVPKHTGLYPAYLSRYYGQLWIARSSREHSERRKKLGIKAVEPVREITHGAHPNQLFIHNPVSNSWDVCSDSNIIKQQRYIAISYVYKDIVPEGTDGPTELRLKQEFLTEVQAVVESLNESAYWIDITLIDSAAIRKFPEKVDKDLYRMADVYRSAQFTLIMLSPPPPVTEKEAWLKYGERLWTLPEALLSRELRFRFRAGDVTPITLHQLANRAYVHLAEESAIVNAYGLRDPLERLERLSLLKAALWRRESSNLKRILEKQEQGFEPVFMAERVYALMGFFEHRIHPHAKETMLQALVRLSMANDNDRLVERMVCLLPPPSPGIPQTACWYAEQDEWGANLWDIEPEIQVVGMTEDHALILGGCRAAAIRWKDFPSIAFATRPSLKRTIANYLPNIFWEILIAGILLEIVYSNSGATPAGVHALLIIGILLMLLAPLLVAYGASGRIVHAQPWLIGVRGLISVEEASDLLYGGSVFALPRTSYSASGTPLSRTETGQFRRGDKIQLDLLKPRDGRREADDLYTLVDTLSATIYYFRAARPPTVCLYMGRESGMGRFVLCSERCTINQLHKETVVRMPWHISQNMRACDWVALG